MTVADGPDGDADVAAGAAIGAPVCGAPFWGAPGGGALAVVPVLDGVAAEVVVAPEDEACRAATSSAATIVAAASREANSALDRVKRRAPSVARSVTEGRAWASRVAPPAERKPDRHAGYCALALASERVAPTRLASDAAMNVSRSPSSTASGLPRSTPVRRSFTSW